jgi:hypothetical protein
MVTLFAHGTTANQVITSKWRFSLAARLSLVSLADVRVQEPQTLQAIRMTPEEYKLASLRYDLWKLRAKGLVEKIPHSRRYRLLPHGYQICLVFLKLYEKIYAPPTAGILRPFAPDQHIPEEKITAIRMNRPIQAPPTFGRRVARGADSTPLGHWRVSVANYRNQAAIGVWHKPRQWLCHR